LKVQGANVNGIQQLASQIRNVFSRPPQVRSVFSEKVAQGFYVNVDVNRDEAARYELTIADVQTAVESGIGGQNIAENIEVANAIHQRSL
jgi:Cu(I)/Ag(I) efflux system membrane protein CusA/SilA